MRGDATPFFLTGDDRGVLLVHGFTGTPFEMRHLGRRLHERGLTVSCPTLPGHGSSASALARTTMHDWYGAVERAFTDLRERCRYVAVAGLSLGGLLGLHLCSTWRGEATALAALATPLWLPPLAQRAVDLADQLPLLPHAVPRLPKLAGSDCRDRTMKRANPAARAMPIAAVRQLAALMRLVKGEISKVETPTLIVHARQDHTAPYSCSEYLARHIGAAIVRHRPLERSYHLITIDVERDEVAAEVAAFFDARFRVARAREAS